jgi:hypothetical protein
VFGETGSKGNVHGEHDQVTEGRGKAASAPGGFLVHVLFHRHLGQSASIIALVATDPPFLDPFLLDIGLAALRTDKDALLIMNHPLFFHDDLVLASGSDTINLNDRMS